MKSKITYTFQQIQWMSCFDYPLVIKTPETKVIQEVI